MTLIVLAVVALGLMAAEITLLAELVWDGREPPNSVAIAARAVGLVGVTFAVMLVPADRMSLMLGAVVCLYGYGVARHVREIRRRRRDWRLD